MKRFSAALLALTFAGCTQVTPSPTVAPTATPTAASQSSPTAAPIFIPAPTLAPASRAVSPDESAIASYVEVIMRTAERLSGAEKLKSGAQALAEIKQAAAEYQFATVPPSMIKADSLMRSSIEREHFAYSFIDSAQQFNSARAMQEAEAPFMEAGELRKQALEEARRVARQFKAENP